jgi:hypothetical protein
MSEPDNLTLVFQRRTDDKLDRVIDEARDFKIHVTMVDEAIAEINRRLDLTELSH